MFQLPLALAYLKPFAKEAVNDLYSFLYHEGGEMLKIRIVGSESELRQVAHKAGSTSIKRFKRDNGKTTFAIDVQISVKDFLENLDLTSDNALTENLSSDPENTCNPQEIQIELENLLDEISDK